jgi:uncharacterized membrane protein YqjE
MQTRREFDRRAVEGASKESFGELLGHLANDSAALVRDEIALAKQEMAEKVSTLRSGIVTVAIGGVIALIAILTLTAAAVIGLAHLIDPGWSALIVGGVLAVIGGVIAFSGLGKIRRTNLKPEQTIETLEEDKEWLKEIT